MDDKQPPRSGRKPRRSAGDPTARGKSGIADGGPAQSGRLARGTVGNTERLRNQAPAPRMRTPRPPLTPTIEDPRPQGAGAKAITERMEQLRYVQDFFHNPVPFDLRERPLESSSPPEEIAQRVTEVQYQINVLQALLVVLNEELEMLSGALPADVKAPAQT